MVEFPCGLLIKLISRCQALDEIGDTSSMDERKRYFKEVDVDQSEGVDFEEYLEVYRITKF